MPEILAPGQLRQEDCEPMAGFGNKEEALPMMPLTYFIYQTPKAVQMEEKRPSCSGKGRKYVSTEGKI